MTRTLAGQFEDFIVAIMDVEGAYGKVLGILNLAVDSGQAERWTDGHTYEMGDGSFLIVTDDGELLEENADSMTDFERLIDRLIQTGWGWGPMEIPGAKLNGKIWTAALKNHDKNHRAIWITLEKYIGERYIHIT